MAAFQHYMRLTRQPACLSAADMPHFAVYITRFAFIRPVTVDCALACQQAIRVDLTRSSLNNSASETRDCVQY